MKKIFIALLIVLSLVALCACKNNENTDQTQAPTAAPTEAGEPAQVTTNYDDIDWETPIDVDDFYVEETVAGGEATEPEAGKPTQGAEETKPGATEPTDAPADVTEAPEQDPTESAPATSKPSGSSNPIELPMIPG